MPLMLHDHEKKGIPRSLVQGYKKFLKNDFVENEHLFARLESKGQAPKVMWIGCSDSRVSPEIILGASPGELFILRNVANIVPHPDSGVESVPAALAFAVKTLGVNHVVVCGHSDCGGVKALSQLGSGLVDPMVASWIKHARSVFDEKGENDSLEDLVKANVVLQAERLLEFDFVLAAAEADSLSIHPCFYNIGTGSLQQFDPFTSEWTSFG